MEKGLDPTSLVSGRGMVLGLVTIDMPKVHAVPSTLSYAVVRCSRGVLVPANHNTQLKGKVSYR